MELQWVLSWSLEKDILESAMTMRRARRRAARHRLAGLKA